MNAIAKNKELVIEYLFSIELIYSSLLVCWGNNG